jgi:predicted nucleic acid-binding protein
VFADATYWIAIASPRDQWHAQASKVSRALKGVEIVTTEEVLSEFLTHYSGHGKTVRNEAIRDVEDIMSDPGVVVLPQSHQSFLNGLDLYKARPDKGYSLTDCISMWTMRRDGIDEVLTHDVHFTQEGFVVLL